MMLPKYYQVVWMLAYCILAAVGRPIKYTLHLSNDGGCNGRLQVVLDIIFLRPLQGLPLPLVNMTLSPSLPDPLRIGRSHSHMCHAL